MIDSIWQFLGEFAELIISLFFIAVIILFIYDRYIQRKHSLLINYPVIGRFRYLFELLREPMRQYFGDETFYESRDKVDWVYTAAKNRPNFMSFSISQPFSGARFVMKHTEHVLNDNEVSQDMSVTFGEGIAGRVAKNGFPMLVNDIEHDKRVAAKNRPRFKTKSLLVFSSK